MVKQIKTIIGKGRAKMDVLAGVCVCVFGGVDSCLAYLVRFVQQNKHLRRRKEKNFFLKVCLVVY